MIFLSRFSLANRSLIALASVAVILAGLVVLPLLKQDELPPITYPAIELITAYPGATPEQVEQDVTTPLEENIRAAAAGESRLHPMVAARLLREVQQRDRSPLGELTPRELEVLAQIARGRSNQEIATELSVSERTVKTHVSNILSKLHLADRTQAAIYALQQRLVPLKEALENE